MRRLLVLALAATLPRVAAAQGYQFADMRWGTPRPTVVSTLKSRGYVITKQEAAGVNFRGTAFEHPMVGFAEFGSRGLARVMLLIGSAAPDLRRTMLDALDEKYGPHDFLATDSTYATWEIHVPVGSYQLALVTNGNHLTVFYESPLTKELETRDEAMRRALRKRAARDF